MDTVRTGAKIQVEGAKEGEKMLVAYHGANFIG